MAHTFHSRKLPKPGALAGYGWLVDKYQLDVPWPTRLALISESHQRSETPDWLVLTPRHAPAESLPGNLTFALKWEGLDLSVLAALTKVVPADTLAGVIREAPTGKYMRRLWFAIEWLTGKRLDLPNADRKRSVVLLLDPDKQIGLIRGDVSERHRVRNTLPGGRDFCPLVRVTPELERLQSQSLSERAREVIGRTRADVMARAAAFLQLSDSKASFAIENEKPQPDRARRWAQAIARAGRDDLSLDSLESLQRIVIEDTRFVELGLRQGGGFVGEHDRDTRRPIPEHISARHDDLPSLMRGLAEYDRRVRTYGMDPVVAAASLAFGFVYVHPFVDGNGRLHRWLIHHVLSAMEFTPRHFVFPVSAVMLRNLDEYRGVLESFSHPLLEHVEWEPTPAGNVNVLNDTADHYRYFDATTHAEFLYRCIEETVVRDLPDEVAYLEAYDRFVSGVQEIVDMPQTTVELLHRFLRQNGGRLSSRARAREFEALEDDEVGRIEGIYRDTTGALGNTTLYRHAHRPQ